MILFLLLSMLRTRHLTLIYGRIYDDAMTKAKGRVVLITGSREFENKELVRQELIRLDRPTIVMHGGAIGADRLAADCIHGDRKRGQAPNGIGGLIELRVPYITMDEKRGGHTRNAAMLEVLKAFRDAGYDCWGIAFHADIHNPSPGTQGMVSLLNKADFVVVHIDEKTNQQY